MNEDDDLDNVMMMMMMMMMMGTWGCYGKSSCKPGLAAAAGVTAKDVRYGESVYAVSLEPLGRMVPESVEALWRIAVQARDRRGVPTAPGQVHRQLRLCLERALLWSTAETLIGATGCERAAVSSGE